MDLANIKYKDNIIKTLTDTDYSTTLATKDNYVELDITASIVVPDYDGSYFPPYLCFTANVESSVTLTKKGDPPGNNFLTSTNRLDWTEYIPGTVIELTNVGDKVYFRGNNPNGISVNSDNCFQFVMGEKSEISASGSIMSLIDIYAATTEIPNTGCFWKLFNSCASLTTAPDLPATILKENCYGIAFKFCTKLQKAPELPAMTLANSCYNAMFQNCDALKSAPDLNATELYDGCYKVMFSNCINLTEIPQKLPATILKPSCYQNMFQGCTSLTKVPRLPATTVATNCYYRMFNNCTSLIVSDTQTTEAQYTWTIPSTGNFLNTVDSMEIFANCPGTRSSNYLVPVVGQQKTYYTLNPPV